MIGIRWKKKIGGRAVARRRNHNYVMLPRVSDRSLQRLRVTGASQTHGDHLRSCIRCRFDRVCNRAVGTAPGGIQYFEHHHLQRIAERRHSRVVRRSRSHNPRRVRAVPVIILPRASRTSDRRWRQCLAGAPQQLAAGR